MRIIKAILGLSSIILLISVSSAYPQDEKVIATIGHRKITFKDLSNEIRMYGKGGNFYEKLLTLTPDGKKKILEKIIREHLLYQAAIDRGVKLDEESEKYLKKLRQNLMVKKYIQKVLEETPITEEEMESYYKGHGEEFIIPEKRKVRHIVAKTEQQAEKILGELRNGGDFAGLAGQHNIVGTRKKGGDLGWIRRGTMVEEFGDVAFSLPEHGISGVVKTRFGYHIIMVEGIKEAVQKKYEDVKREVKKKVEGERIRELEERLKGEYKVQVDYGLLESPGKGEGGER